MKNDGIKSATQVLVESLTCKITNDVSDGWCIEHALSLSLSHTHTHTHTCLLSLSNTPCHIHFLCLKQSLSFYLARTSFQSAYFSPLNLTLSLSLSLSHTHTPTHTNTPSLTFCKQNYLHLAQTVTTLKFQCDHMSKLSVQYWAINKNEILSNVIKICPISRYTTLPNTN